MGVWEVWESDPFIDLRFTIYDRKFWIYKM